jgi:hypothetical protein
VLQIQNPNLLFPEKAAKSREKVVRPVPAETRLRLQNICCGNLLRSIKKSQATHGVGII